MRLPADDDPPPNDAEAGDGEERDEAIITTNKGVITIELYPERAPITVENFKQYVTDGFYNGVVFHRVIPNFMIQTAGTTKSSARKSQEKPSKTKPPTA